MRDRSIGRRTFRANGGGELATELVATQNSSVQKASAHHPPRLPVNPAILKNIRQQHFGNSLCDSNFGSGSVGGSQRGTLLADQLQQRLLRIGEFLQTLVHQRFFEVLHVDQSIDLGQHFGRWAGGPPGV